MYGRVVGGANAFGPGGARAFGPGAAPAFGARAPPAFGPGGAPAFGARAAPAFGTGAPPAFGTGAAAGPVGAASEGLSDAAQTWIIVGVVAGAALLLGALLWFVYSQKSDAAEAPERREGKPRPASGKAAGLTLMSEAAATALAPPPKAAVPPDDALDAAIKKALENVSAKRVDASISHLFGEDDAALSLAVAERLKAGERVDVARPTDQMTSLQEMLLNAMIDSTMLPDKERQVLAFLRHTLCQSRLGPAATSGQLFACVQSMGRQPPATGSNAASSSAAAPAPGSGGSAASSSPVASPIARA